MLDGTTSGPAMDLYRDYYGSDVSRAIKRSITADMSLSHIRALVGTRTFERVADVGAGEGSLAKAMRLSGVASQVTALEISESGLEEIARLGVDGVIPTAFDGYRIEAPDKGFDLAVSVHVLEHVEHPRLFLRELARVSRQAIVEVPLEFTSNLERRIAVMRPYGHLNFFSATSFRDLLETSGLRPVRLEIFNTTLAYERHLNPRLGSVKHTIRELALRAAPRLATRRLVYMAAALCETVS